MLPRCHGPELEGMEDESPHGKKELVEGNREQCILRDALRVRDVCWLRSLRYIEIRCLAQSAKTGGRFGEKQLKMCVLWSPGSGFRKHLKSSFLCSSVCSFTKGRQCKELQSTPLPMGDSLRVPLFSLEP